MSPLAKTVYLGDEYDDTLRKTLLLVLREVGAHLTEQTRGVGGSQELERLKVSIGGQAVVIEAETYVGLSVTGAERLVDEIARRVRARLAGG